jgi:YfiH family protein
MGTGVTAFSTTRQGGCSTGNYAAFNINGYCGDDEVHIAANKVALCSLLGIDSNRLVMPHQVHDCVVRRIDGPQQGVIEGVDAVMTDVPQLCIGVSTADCIPVLLYDSIHRAVSAVHAGWRGTVLRIVQKAVEAMHDTYGTAPADLQAVIGPGISLDSFEVGDEVYDQFLSAGFDMQPISRRDAKWHIDLPMCNRLQLMEAGIPSNNIQMTNICTYQQYDRYFSARRLGIQSGRIYTGILIK